MSQAEQYTIWVKPVGTPYDINSIVANVAALEDVLTASRTNIDASGISKKEAVFAVALSVTANFATDGLKVIFSHFEAGKAAKVVMCRRSDGSDVPVKLAPTED